MKLIISLQAMAPDGAATTASVDGDVLTYNGEKYDLSAIPNGGMGVVNEGGPFSGNIERINGVLMVPMRWLFDPYRAEPVQPAEPIEVDTSNGAVADPVARIVDVKDEVDA